MSRPGGLTTLKSPKFELFPTSFISSMRTQSHRPTSVSAVSQVTSERMGFLVVFSMNSMTRGISVPK